MNLLVLKPFKEQFEPIVEELVAPLDELIPEPVKEFLSPGDTLKEMGGNVVRSALDAILHSGGDQAAGLVAKFVEKGVANAKPAAEETEQKTG